MCRLYFSRWPWNVLPSFILFLLCRHSSPVVGLMLPPLEFGQACNYGGSEALWLLKLGHKRPYSTCVVLLGQSLLESKLPYCEEAHTTYRCSGWGPQLKSQLTTSINHQTCEWRHRDDSNLSHHLTATAWEIPSKSPPSWAQKTPEPWKILKDMLCTTEF